MPTTKVGEAAAEGATLAGPSPRVTQIQTLLFISGFSALVLEVVYVKLLRYWAGNTAYAVGAVLCAYMAGLAAGSFAAGKWLVNRRRLLGIYGCMELLIGFYSLGLPGLQKALEPSYLALTARLGPNSHLALAGHFLAGVVLLLFPTLLMGATFPVAVRAASQALADRASAAEEIYYANLAGAALGTLLSDFLLIRFWGLGASLRLVALLNSCLALAAGTLEWRSSTREQPPASPERVAARHTRGESWVLLVAFAGGFLVLLQELIWTNMVGRFLDSTVYGFAVTLFVVIAGLSGGAALVTRWPAARPGESVAWPCLGAGVVSLALFPFWDHSKVLAKNHPALCVGAAVLLLAGVVAVISPRVRVVGWYLAAAAGVTGAILLRQRFDEDGAVFWIFHGVDFSVSTLFLVVPAVLMGMIFPLVLKWYLESGEGESRSVARVYALNTLGCLAGIIAATFLILPRWGVEWSGRLNGLLFCVLGFVVLRGQHLDKARDSRGGRPWLTRLSERAGRDWRWVALALLPALAWAFFAPRWNFITTLRLLEHEGAELYSGEDLNGGITTVLDDGNDRKIFVNTLYNGGTRLEERDQARVALIPLLYVREFDRAMVIGMGTGETAGLLGQFPFRQLDIVDFSPRVLEAAERYFSAFNLNICRDPRVRLHVADGRHYLLTRPQKYSLLTTEVNRLYTSGEGDLYTHEFYELCASRLTEHGVLQQWVPLFSLTIPDTITILRTVRQVFPYVTLYEGGTSGTLVASRSPLVLSYRRFEEVQSKPPLRAVLERIGLPHAVSLLGDRVLTPAGADALLARPGERRISTDLNPYLEYSCARQRLGYYVSDELWGFLLSAEEFHVPRFEGLDESAQLEVWKLANEERQKQFDSVGDH